MYAKKCPSPVCLLSSLISNHTHTLRIEDIYHQREGTRSAAVVFSCDGGVNLDFVAGTKEVVSEQPPARHLSAVIRMILQGTNVAHMPPF